MLAHDAPSFVFCDDDDDDGGRGRRHRMNGAAADVDVTVAMVGSRAEMRGIGGGRPAAPASAA